MCLNESTVEDITLEWFEELGYAISHGPQFAPGEPAAERATIKRCLPVRFARTMNP